MHVKSPHTLSLFESDRSLFFETGEIYLHWDWTGLFCCWGMTTLVPASGASILFYRQLHGKINTTESIQLTVCMLLWIKAECKQIRSKKIILCFFFLRAVISDLQSRTFYTRPFFHADISTRHRWQDLRLMELSHH